MHGVDAAAIDALLPQTQCTRCGYAGCLPYAEALAAGRGRLNQCPPGGAALIAQLAALLGRAAAAARPGLRREAPPRVAWIDRGACIGCARCLPPCPVDAIIGARRQLHTVIASTGARAANCACRPARWTASAWCRGRRRPAPGARRHRGRYRAHGASARSAARRARGELRAEAAQRSCRRAKTHHDARGAPALLRRAARGQSGSRARELEYGTPFQLLVAVILSAQATDKSVNAATRRAVPRRADARGDAGARPRRPEAAHPHDRPVQLQGEAHPRDLAGCCSNATAARCPASARRWRRCPGSGRKTANVVLNTAFGEPTIAVDTHIFRVANRTGLAPGKTPRAVEDRLLAVTPARIRAATRITG